MKIRIPLVLVTIGALSFAALAQSVTVTGKKVTYKRPKPQMDYKKTFTVTYPKIKASTPALSKKIESTFSYERVFKLSLAEDIKDFQWLEDASYEVKYNRNGILCLDLSIEGTAAYPDGSTKTVCADIATGSQITPANSFTNLSGLAAMVKKAQQKEIAASIIEIKKETEANELDPKTLFETTDFKVKDLDLFSISDKGVTFKYDYGFPHVIEALQPSGEFIFSWTQLKPYIKTGSLLSRIAH